MNYEFNQLLDDIGTYLIGRELHSINPSTPPIYLVKLAIEENRYYIASSLSSKAKPRNINELREIWSDLVKKGFANVDQSLYGGGSSRNQPETVIANLPYIQYFKFKNKKHILLRNHHVHEPATISEVQGANFRKVRKLVENYHRLNISTVTQEQSDFLGKMNGALSLIFKKYPGEAAVQEVNSLLEKLNYLNEDLAESIVTLDSNVDQKSHLPDKKLINKEEFLPLETLINSAQQTGIDEGELGGDEDEDDYDDGFDSSNSQAKTNLNNPIILPRIRQLTPVLSLIFDRINFGDIELRPDFQRKDRIWKLDKKAKLIESILMRLPLPVFYFAEKSDGKWVVVDGLQRITTVYDFISGEFSLGSLKVLPQHDGKFFKDLTRTEQRDIREYAITAYLIDMNADNSKMIVELFHRINTYGVKLSDQEIRSALNQGNSVKFLRYLASLEEFQLATKNKINPDRQKDMELCLSALSFMVLGYQSFDNNRYGEYLAEAMKVLNKLNLNIKNEIDIDAGKATIDSNSIEYLEIANQFTKALVLAKEIFGDIAFVKEPGNNRAPISKQLFELIITYFSQLSEEQEKTLLLKQVNFIDALHSAIEDNTRDFARWESTVYEEANRGFRDSISTSTGKKVTVKYRFEAFRAILKASTGIDLIPQPLIKKYDSN